MSRRMPRHSVARQDTLEADFAALSQQVSNQDEDIQETKRIVLALDKKIDATTINLSNKIDNSHNALSTKLDAHNITPWQSIFGGLTVLVGLMTTIGYLALQPNTESIRDLRAELKFHETKLDSKSAELDQLLGAVKLLGKQ